MWNVLYIAIASGKASLYPLVATLPTILNGPTFFVVKFPLWSRDLDIAWQEPDHIS